LSDVAAVLQFLLLLLLLLSVVSVALLSAWGCVFIDVTGGGKGGGAEVGVVLHVARTHKQYGGPHFVSSTQVSRSAVLAV